MLQTIRGDYERHGGAIRNPALWTLEVYRFGVWSQNLDSRIARWGTSKLYGALYLGIELATGSTVNREAKIGDAPHFVHSGNIKIHPDVVIGDRVGIMHDVTLGTGSDRPGVPKIGNDVFIGAGAKILGDVEIGDGAIVAANSLVIKSVPAGATAIGVPARVIGYTRRADSRNEGGIDVRCVEKPNDVERDRSRSTPVHLRQLSAR